VRGFHSQKQRKKSLSALFFANFLAGLIPEGEKTNHWRCRSSKLEEKSGFDRKSEVWYNPLGKANSFLRIDQKHFVGGNMLDINLIRTNPEKVKNALLKKVDSVDLDTIIELDAKKKHISSESESLKALRNMVSNEIQKLKSSKQSVTEKIDEMKAVGEKIKKLDDELNTIESELNGILSTLPNIPPEDVPAGGKENNIVLRNVGEKPSIDSNFMNHVDLAKKLNLIDYERGAKLGGSGFSSLSVAPLSV
jgi:hypothetical protein